MRIFFLLLTLITLKLTAAHAIPEADYQNRFKTDVLKFLRDQGKTFVFEGEAGLLLPAIRFTHVKPAPGPDTPAPRGTIVVLPGRSEPYLKYAEVFYDLYQLGYDIYSYDHRGQGLGQHLSSRNAQIGHIDEFEFYFDDLHAFTDRVQAQAGGPLYLLAHSMGGGIAARFLTESASGYQKAVLSAPMLELNTQPYPQALAHAIVGTANRLFFDNHYAIGFGDYDLNLPFASNVVTHSEARFWMGNEIARLYPNTQIGGPSNRWVLQALNESKTTVHEMSAMRTPTLILQAGQDVLVNPEAQERGCARARLCTIQVFENAKHEILMESDAIRDVAFQAIDAFFRE